MQLSYDNRVFKSISNSETGEVSGETTFYYRQKDNFVWAEYSGGAIIFGTLIAKILENGVIEMRYQHLNRDKELMTGKCISTPELLPDGRIRLYEKWQWTSGDLSTGESIVEEVIQSS